MKYGIINISDLDEKMDLSAGRYLNSDDYVTCLRCRKIVPVEKTLDKDFCSEDCKKSYLKD